MFLLHHHRRPADLFIIGSQSGVVGFEDPLSEEERYNAAQAEVDEINAYVKKNIILLDCSGKSIMLMSQKSVNI